MLTQSTRVFLPLTVLALVACLFYLAFTGDFTGAVLYLLLMVAAATATIVVTAARENEVAPVVPADAPPPVVHHLAPAPRVGGGGWPLAAATAVTLTVLGLVVGPVSFIAGLVLAAATAVGWLARLTGDHLGRDINLLPLGIPAVALFAIGSLMYLMSRVLLALPEQGATFTALIVAMVILAAGSVVALRPVSGRTIMAALALGGVVTTGGGIVAAAVGEREIGHHDTHAAHSEIELEARNVAFDVPEVHFKAGEETTIDFLNEDVDIIHNFALARDEAFEEPIFQGPPITGPDRITYHLEPLPAGVFFFRCDFHLNMAGRAVVA